MEVPLSFESPIANGKMHKLKNTLYGLKESPKVWFETFSKICKSVTTSKVRLIKHSSQEDNTTVRAVYVDDIVLCR